MKYLLTLALLSAIGLARPNDHKWFVQDDVLVLPSVAAYLEYHDYVFAHPELFGEEPDTVWLKTCAGWTALELCSTIFGSGIDEETAWNEDVGYIPRSVVEYEMDYTEKSATVTCKFFNPDNLSYKAIFREYMGCTLVERLTEEEIRAQDVGDQTPPAPLDPTVAWPRGEGFFPEDAPEGVDLECVNRVIDEDFALRIPNTRAITVSYRDHLIAERYASTVNQNTRLLGWSATKSVTNAMIALSVKDGMLDIYEPAPVPEWANDERKNITIDMMLRMSSGTRWVGDIAPTTECVYWSDANCAHTSANQPLVEEPDTVWNYNSGSTYVLSRIALENRIDQQWNNFEYPKRRLFQPIGAHSFYIEFQPNEIFLGGSMGYATSRDWNRFGLLFMRDGVWIDGTRILPEGWAKYSATATPTNAAGSYAAHFWRFPNTDPDEFHAGGFRNQNVFIFPKQQIVIARNAMPVLVGHPVWDEEGFASKMLSCFNSTMTN